VSRPPHQLVSIRELRIAKLETELQAARNALERVGGHLRDIDRERDELRQQSARWERQWQEWLSQDGMLCRGQTYNLRHLNLAAWERDIDERRTEIVAAHEAAEADHAAAREKLHRAQRHVDALKDVLRTLDRQQRLRTAARAEARSTEETCAHDWTLHHGLHSSARQ